MGIITVEKSNRLLWLGRYTERVFTTLKSYLKSSDRMIDKDEHYYAELCEKIGIPDVYGSRAGFVKNYPFDAGDPNSIISNLNRAYDNAIVLRDDIGTETMAYIQLAIDDIEIAERGGAPMADLMLVLDHLLAFWGCVNDHIDDEQTRNIIKLGKGVERLDLYLSLEMPEKDIKKEYRRTKQFLQKSRLRYDESVINTVDSMMNDSGFAYRNVRNLIRMLLVE